MSIGLRFVYFNNIVESCVGSFRLGKSETGIYMKFPVKIP